MLHLKTQTEATNWLPQSFQQFSFRNYTQQSYRNDGGKLP